MFTLERDKDTICATATAPGAGAIAVIRLSGDKSTDIIRKVAPFLPENIESHKVYYGFLLDPQTKQHIDEVLISFFAKGRSFTGEASFEISCHGSGALIGKIIDGLIFSGARMAQRGEFTYRAFSSGRIDLIQAESILALVESQSGLGSRMALRQLKGELSQQLGIIEDDLTWCLSRLEANLDFSSEFIEFASAEEILAHAKSCHSRVQKLLKTYQIGRVLRSGLKVALVGAPNAGKSSLLNVLARQDRAIVSPIEGTTRDVIEVDIELNGQKLIIADTAGLRSTKDQLEALGVAKTIQTIFDADIICYIADASRIETFALPSELVECDKPIIYVINKSDLNTTSNTKLNSICISTKSELGIDKLKEELTKNLLGQHEESSVVLLNSRHFELLSKAESHVSKGILLLIEGASPEFIISEFQEALVLCFEMAGKQYDDEVLDRVFREFCLGK